MFRLIAKYLQASDIEKDIQSFVNHYCSSRKIPPIQIKFTDKNLGGQAFYQTRKSKGTITNQPMFIMIGDWSDIKDIPSEWIYRLAHELAHHEMNCLTNSLGHTNKHDKLTNDIERVMTQKFKKNTAEIDRLQNKIKYWEANKNKIQKDHDDANLKIDVVSEINKMKDKLKELL